MFLRSYCPRPYTFTSQTTPASLLLPLPLGEGWSEESALYGVATFR